MRPMLFSFLFFAVFHTWASDTHYFGGDHASLYETSLVDHVRELKISSPEVLKKASWPMPVIDKNVLYFGDKENNLIALDLKSNKIKWKVGLNGARVHGAPYLDANKSRLYFTSADWREIKGDSKFKYEIHTFINQIDLDGSQLKSFEFNHAAYLDPQRKLKMEDPNRLLHCKTSLGLAQKSKAGLFFGCSMYTYGGLDIYNRESKGVRGVLYFVPLDKKGDIQFKATSAFTPSKVAPGADNGFDTGIWNSGAGPTELDDGSIVLATGNGPLDKKNENFGCSIIRIDPLSKKILNTFSADEGNFAECDFNGLDFSSSSLALYKKDKKTLGFISNKGGELFGLDPYQFSNDNLLFRINFSHSSFGRPLVYEKEKSGEIMVLASGYDKRANHPPIEFMAPETMGAMFKNYEIKKCLGYLKSGDQKSRALHLYYSGPHQDDYLLSAKKAPLLKFERRVFVDQKKSISWEKADQNEQTKLGLKEIRAQMRSYKLPAEGESIGLQNWSEETKQQGLVYGDKVEEEFSFYAPINGRCDKDLPGFIRLNHYARKDRHKIFPPEMNLINVSVSMSGKWKENYQVSHQNIRPHNTNSILLKASGEEKLLWLVMAFDMTKSEKNSKALFIDPLNGKIVRSLDFYGVPKFSMPVLNEGKIYVSTYDEGTKVISL